MDILKMNYVIQRLKEFQLCNNKQNMIKTIKDGNIILKIIIK